MLFSTLTPTGLLSGSEVESRVRQAAIDAFGGMQWHRAGHGGYPGRLETLAPYLDRSPELRTCCTLQLSRLSAHDFIIEARGDAGGTRDDIWRVDQKGRLEHVQDGRDVALLTPAQRRDVADAGWPAFALLAPVTYAGFWVQSRRRRP